MGPRNSPFRALLRSPFEAEREGKRTRDKLQAKPTSTDATVSGRSSGVATKMGEAAVGYQEATIESHIEPVFDTYVDRKLPSPPEEKVMLIPLCTSWMAILISVRFLFKLFKRSHEDLFDQTMMEPDPTMAEMDNVSLLRDQHRMPLHEAVEHRDPHDVLSPVDHGEDPNTGDYDQETPLYLASRSGKPETVRLLLENGADMNHRNLTGWTPLHEASAQGRHDVVQLLLEHGANVDAQTNKSQWTPLHLASVKGEPVVARTLLGFGAEVDARDAMDCTPLHLASQQGHKELVWLLFDHSTDVLARDHEGHTFLDVAWARGYKEMVDVDARYSEDQTALHIAAQHGNPDLIRWLIDRDADLNAQDENKETPLFPVSRNGKLEATLLLLEHGADVNHRDWQKRTPLHGASENGRHDVAQSLLEHDAEVDAQNVYDWTPLHLASRTGMRAVTQVLTEGGANMDVQNDFGWTPLHMASQKGHDEVVELLLSRGAGVNIKEAVGETALHLAAYYGHLGIVEALLKHGADRLNQNKEGKTPLDLASKEGHQDIAQKLRRKHEKQAKDSYNSRPNRLYTPTPDTKQVEKQVEVLYDNHHDRPYTSTPFDFVRFEGFLTRMFGRRDAAFFIESLLKVDARDVHLVGKVSGWTDAIMTQIPSTHDARVDALGPNNQSLYLLDFIPLPIYGVVPQKIWTPPNQSDWRRYVEQASLRMPVFFIQNDGTVGLPLDRALSGDRGCLRLADMAAPLGGGHSTQIRIAWPGYESWERQIQIRDMTRQRNEITLERFAKLVAGVVDRFLVFASSTAPSDPTWRVGLGGITRNNIIIVGTVQVSAGGWMPILSTRNSPASSATSSHFYPMRA